MKNSITVLLIMLLTVAVMVPTSLASVSTQDVKTAFTGSLLSSGETENVLNVKTASGESIKKWTKPEFIHKMYHVVNDGDAAKDIFYAYKTGSFGNEIDKGSYYWIIPQFEGNLVVKEHFYYPNAATTDGSAEIKGAASGLVIIYDYDKLSKLIESANIGVPKVIRRAIITYPSPTVFLYVLTDKGEYIIPMLSSIGIYYNKYNDDKIKVEPLTVYTAGDFVVLYQKETQGKKQQIEEYQKKNQKDDPTDKVDSNGEVITITPTPSPSSTPVPSASPRVTATPSVTPEGTTSPEPNNELTTSDKADKLKAAGLFKGTDKGYELEKTFTRAEGATMLVRLMGKEATAISGAYKVVFADVSSDNWTFPYVMYAYTSGIIKGTGVDTFTPDRAMTGAEFATLLLRIIGNSEAEPSTALSVALSNGLITKGQADSFSQAKAFTRGDMVELAYGAYLKIR